MTPLKLIYLRAEHAQKLHIPLQLKSLKHMVKALVAGTLLEILILDHTFEDSLDSVIKFAILQE
jgi:hypothetical protein